MNSLPSVSPTWWSPRACPPPGTAACPRCPPSPRCCCWSLKSAPNLVLRAASRASCHSRSLLSVSASLSRCLLLICCSVVQIQMSIQTQLVFCFLFLVFQRPATNTAASCAALVRCLLSSTRPLPWLLGPRSRAESTRDEGQLTRSCPASTHQPCVVCAALTQGHCTTVQMYNCTHTVM